MAYDSIQVAPVTPHIGAEIGGVDLTRPLSNRQVDELNDALTRHIVLFFRDQPIDPGMLKTVGRSFGELHVHSGGPGIAGHAEVRPVHADGNSKQVVGETWHSDSTCDSEPPMGSILHLHTIPPVGGDTLFASMYAAYDALSAKMQAFLEGLTATHDAATLRRKLNPGSTQPFPANSHPVIATHPVSRRKVIFVNEGFTSHINELSAGESAAVLAYLYKHCTQPCFQVRFRWRANSIAFWDNRCSQHQAIWDYFPHVRSGNRVQVKGTAPRP